jgi:hypothetical protein
MAVTVLYLRDEYFRDCYEALRFPDVGDVPNYDGLPKDERQRVLAGHFAAVSKARSENAYAFLKDGKYKPVAILDIDAMAQSVRGIILGIEAHDEKEVAWKIMQNGAYTDSWTLAPPSGLTVLVEPIVKDGRRYGHKSCDIGDVIVQDGVAYVVDNIGFTRLGAYDVDVAPVRVP